jgi:DNA-binding NtrC family response regulator
MQHGVLFVSPSSDNADLLAQMLQPLSIPLQQAPDLRRARSRLDHEKYGVVLTEARLPDGDWQDVMKAVGEVGVASTVVVTHAFTDARFWADVLESGGYDVLAQPFYCSEVQRIISNALTPTAAYRNVSHSASWPASLLRSNASG